MFFLKKIQNFLRNLGHNSTCFEYGVSTVQGVSRLNENSLIQANCDARKGGQPDGL